MCMRLLRAYPHTAQFVDTLFACPDDLGFAGCVNSFRRMTHVLHIYSKNFTLAFVRVEECSNASRDARNITVHAARGRLHPRQVLSLKSRKCLLPSGST